MRRLARWFRRGPALKEEPVVCAERLQFLLEPTQPHPGGAHICRLLGDHLRLGIGHACRNCSVEWWPR